MSMQLQEKKSPFLDHDFPAPETGFPSPCSDRGSILDIFLPASVGLHWNCGEPSHSFLRNIRKQMKVGFHKKLRALRFKRNLRLIRIRERKKTKTQKMITPATCPQNLSMISVAGATYSKKKSL